MATYNRFGVYTTESTLRASPANIPATTATTAAFFGTAARGPVTPTVVNSWPDYQKYFGGIELDKEMGYALYHYFSNGGRTAYVTRVVGAGASVATCSSAGYYADDQATVASAFTLEAKNPGVWGNDLTISLAAGTVTPTASRLPTFRLSIALSGTEVENWTDLSLDPASGRYVQSVLDNYSSYVNVTDVATVTPSETFYYRTGETHTFTGGSAGSDPTSGDYSTALDLLDDIEGTLLINLVGKSDATHVNLASTKAAARGNSFVIADPDPTVVINGVVDASAVNTVISGYTNPNYVAAYYPMLTMVDPARSGPAAIRETYPGGAVAGAYARVDTERGVGKTPAGYGVDVRGGLALSGRLPESVVGALYDYGVNTFKAVPGAGVVILGGRTLEPSRPDKFISIRRSLNFIKQGINDIARSSLFEPNDADLWADIRSRVDQFLTTFWGQGGLKGATAANAFYIVCDDTNNLPETVEEGIVNVEVGVALQYPAEFIVVQVSQWTGGSNTTEVVPETL